MFIAKYSKEPNKLYLFSVNDKFKHCSEECHDCCVFFKPAGPSCQLTSRGFCAIEVLCDSLLHGMPGTKSTVLVDRATNPATTLTLAFVAQLVADS